MLDPGLPSPLTQNPPATAAKNNPVNQMADDKCEKCIQVPLEPRLMPGDAQGGASLQPRTMVAQPAGLCPLSLLAVAGHCYPSPVLWAPGLTLGFVGHEAEEQGVHFSTVAVTFSASASSSTLPLQQLGVAVTEGTLLLT